jgi:hydrogenase maturation protease
VRTVVVGIGNPFRRDDGVGPAVIGLLQSRVAPEVSLVVSDGEPTSRLDAWSDGGAVVVVDGIEVADTRWGPGLSPDVAAGAGAAAERILAEPGVRPRAER